jgi:hypothetical protein
VLTLDITKRDTNPWFQCCGLCFLPLDFQIGVGHHHQLHVTFNRKEVSHLVITPTERLLGDAVEILNGMITNDKFCLTRWGELQLSWWRRPLRLRG